MIFKIKSRENKPRARRWAWHVCWRRLGRWSMAMALCLTRRDAQSLSHIPRFSANQANIPLLYYSIQHKIRVIWDRGPQPLTGTRPHSRSEQSIICIYSHSHRSQRHLSSTSCRISSGFRFSQEPGPCCELHMEGTQVCAPYENLMVDDLWCRWRLSLAERLITVVS